MGLRCSADADRVMYNKCGQRTEAADVVQKAGTNFLSVPSLMLTPMLSKIARLFYMALTPLSVYLFSLCNEPNKLV